MQRFGKPDVYSVCNWVLPFPTTLRRGTVKCPDQAPTFSICASSTPVTGTWVGRCISFDLGGAQQNSWSAIRDLVVAEGIDCIPLAGDVFDRAIPPVQSVKLFTEALLPSSPSTAPSWLLQAITILRCDLGYGSPLFRSGVHVVTDIESVGVPITLTEDGVSVRIYPIPFP